MIKYDANLHLKKLKEIFMKNITSARVRTSLPSRGGCPIRLPRHVIIFIATSVKKERI